MVKLQYPVFIFTENDMMVYVFLKETEHNFTTLEYLAKTDFTKDTFIDSSGMKYFPRSTYITHVWGFWKRLWTRFLRLGAAKLVTFDYNYKDDAGIPVSLDELKAMIMERYPKSRWFHSSWCNVKEFKREINKCSTFEEVAVLMH